MRFSKLTQKQKISRIPKDLMHEVPTALLFSLEGIPEPEWVKLLKLQFPDGSFLFSPSSTAYALMHTKDNNCLRYLTKVVEKFNGGVPNVYPVDLFEHIWAVDRLQRLGISRYFQTEIEECMDYVFRYWTKEGICWARNSRIYDIDDTAMGFRLLRMHGYGVSQDVFRNFENKGEFFCIAGQSNQAVTGMFNLFRASQVLFPGEKVLEDAKKFSLDFLREKQVKNQLLDKWIITKDLPGELHDEDSCSTYKNGITTMKIESSMQELVQLVFCNSSGGLDRQLKQTFFMVTRTFYYTAYCDPETIGDHIVKVLFDRKRVQ